MVENTSGNEHNHQPPQLQPDIMSSTAEASSRAFEQKKAEEAKEAEETENEDISEEEQQNVSVKMQQSHAKKQKEFKEKIKPIEGEIKELDKDLIKLTLLKVSLIFVDMFQFVARYVSFSWTLWWTIVMFIIDWLVIVPGIIILVAVGVLKGAAAKQNNQKIKDIKKQISDKQKQINQEKEKFGLGRAETQ